MMNRMNARLLAAIVGGVTLVGFAAAPALAQDAPAAPKTKHQEKDAISSGTIEPK